MAISIRFADANDTDAVAEVCNASFDPTTDHMTRNLFPEHLQPTGIPDGDALLPWRRSRKRYKLTEYRAVIMVAVDDELDGKVVGFTVWESPVYDNTEELERKEPKVPCDALDDAAFQEMKDVTNECFDNLFGKDGLRNMWYLDYLGVDRTHQRRGIGKMLLDWGLQKAQSEGRDCVLLATPAGKPLYEKVGFETLGIAPLFGVDHYPMLKRAVN